MHETFQNNDQYLKLKDPTNHHCNYISVIFSFPLQATYYRSYVTLGCDNDTLGNKGVS
jgi:hypothetical protein